MWNDLSAEERARPRLLKAGKLGGTWSLNQAALFLAACEGLDACQEPLPPGTVVKNDQGQTTRYLDAHHRPCHLEAWTTLAPAMSEETLDAPILTRTLAGRSVTLTARGLKALAQWEWAMHDHLGATVYQPIPCGPQGTVGEREVRVAVDALQVMRTVVSAKRLSSLDKLLAQMIRPTITPDERETPWFNQLRDTFGLTELVALQGRLWRQRPQDWTQGLHFRPGLAFATLLIKSPAATVAWSEADRAHLPNVWEDLTKEVMGGTVPPNQKRLYQELADQVGSRGQLLAPLRQWGFEPTVEQWNTLKQALLPLLKNDNVRSQVEAEGRAWEQLQTTALPDQAERRRPRLRS